MKRQYVFPIAAFIIIAGAGAFIFAYLHGAHPAVLAPSGPVALEERWVIITTALLSSIVVIPVFGLLFFFAWRYRATNARAHEEHHPDWDHDNMLVEFTWWLVPAVIILILGVIMWKTTHGLDPYRELPGDASLAVDVVALDWKWLFIYPDEGIASVNRLVIPENRPVHFYLTADAPMNSFWIPALGGQIMVMPGMITQLNLMADKAGSYNGYSGNISGAGFSGMAFSADAMTPEDFDAWVASTKAGTASLDLPAYTALAEPSSYDPVSYYSSVAPGLYNAIVMKFMMPGGMQMMGTGSSTNAGSMDMEHPHMDSMPMDTGGMDMNMPMEGMDMQMMQTAP